MVVNSAREAPRRSFVPALLAVLLFEVTMLGGRWVAARHELPVRVETDSLLQMAAWRHGRGRPASDLRTGDPAPPLQLRTADGRRAASVTGRPLAVVFLQDGSG